MSVEIDTTWQKGGEDTMHKQAQIACDHFLTQVADTKNISRFLTRKVAPTSLAFGYAAPALFLAQCEDWFPQHGFDELAHTFLLQMFPQPFRCSDFSLINGVAGASAVVWLLSRKGERYPALLRTLDQAVFAHIRSRSLSQADPETLTLADYDLLFGRVGLGVYLFFRKQDPEALQLLHLLQRSLSEIAFSSPTGLPFFLSPAQVIDRDRTRYPDGYTILGIAHGVAGVLLFLALLHREGLQTPEATTTLERLAHWLASQAMDEGEETTWPAFFSPLQPREAYAHDSWCYGPPGIAWALWQAGQVLGVPSLQAKALLTLHAVCSRREQQWGLHQAGLCHGTGGLLHLLRCFQQVSPQDALLNETIAFFHQKVRQSFDAQTLFGWKDVRSAHEVWDNPGFLSGASGTLLALLAAELGAPTIWSSFLLLGDHSAP